MTKEKTKKIKDLIKKLENIQKIFKKIEAEKIIQDLKKELEEKEEDFFSLKTKETILNKFENFFDELREDLNIWIDFERRNFLYFIIWKWLDMHKTTFNYSNFDYLFENEKNK